MVRFNGYRREFDDVANIERGEVERGANETARERDVTYIASCRFTQARTIILTALFLASPSHAIAAFEMLNVMYLKTLPLQNLVEKGLPGETSKGEVWDVTTSVLRLLKTDYYGKGIVRDTVEDKISQVRKVGMYKTLSQQHLF